MSPYIQSILLGIVEGLTEFLPVSSTAHLRITEALMKIPLGRRLLEDVHHRHPARRHHRSLHAVPVADRGLHAHLSRGRPRRNNWFNHPISLTLIAFVCTSVPALLLHKWSEKNLGSLNAMALALLIGGIVMWIVDAGPAATRPDTSHVEEMTLLQAIWIGLCQTLSAIFPGTSRSMSTIAAGQMVGLNRPAALEFSFLLSIPTMVAATGWDLIKEIHGSKSADGAVAAAHVVMNSERWIVLAHRPGGLLHRGPGRGGVVPSLGPQARIHHVRHLPHPARQRAAALGSEVIGADVIMRFAASPPGV